MSGRKTETLYASAALDGHNLTTAVESITQALENLLDVAAKQGRIVLYDTLVIDTERIVVDDSTFTDLARGARDAGTVINVNASAVKL